MMTWLLAVAAAAVALWPINKKSGLLPSLETLDTKPKPSSYLDAVASLQTVRTRLMHTNHLDDDQAAACDVLTLALSAGSDQE